LGREQARCVNLFSLNISLRVFTCPKEGNSEAELEDSCYPSRDKVLNAPSLRFALSDGASESFLSGKWAQILTRAFCRSHDDAVEFEGFYARAIEAWHHWYQAYIEQRNRRNRPILWYEEPGLRSGAFATILGLRIDEADGGTWKAFAVGDSCLFQVQGQTLTARFPIGSSSEFNNFPALIASDQERNRDLEKKIVKTGGTWQVGDKFFMMSDALAQWFLKEHEQGLKPWDMLGSLGSPDALESFSAWVYSLRTQKAIRNDDTTLLQVSLG
jgi:hypothetical protein